MSQFQSKLRMWALIAGCWVAVGVVVLVAALRPA